MATYWNWAVNEFSPPKGTGKRLDYFQSSGAEDMSAEQFAAHIRQHYPNLDHSTLTVWPSDEPKPAGPPYMRPEYFTNGIEQQLAKAINNEVNHGSDRNTQRRDEHFGPRGGFSDDRRGGDSTARGRYEVRGHRRV